MKFEEILKDINENNLKNVYIFYGEENYLIDYSIKLIKQKYIKENFESLNYVALEGKEIEFDTIYDACETLPFMSEKKIVVVSDLGTFGRKRKDEFEVESSSQKNDKLKKYISNLGNHVVLIFVEKEKPIDRNKSIVKTINKVGGLVEFKKLRGKDLNMWIQKTLKKYNKSISYYDINYLIEYSSYFSREGNKTLYDLENEIAKLANFAGDRKYISKDDIDKIMAKSLETNIFKLLDNIGAKDGDQSLKIFNEMCISNEPLPKILYMIIRQFRLLRQCKILKDNGYLTKEATEKLKISEYEYKKISKQSMNFSKEQLDKALGLCLMADKKVKSIATDNKLILEMLIVSLCQ